MNNSLQKSQHFLCIRLSTVIKCIGATAAIEHNPLLGSKNRTKSESPTYRLHPPGKTAPGKASSPMNPAKRGVKSTSPTKNAATKTSKPIKVLVSRLSHYLSFIFKYLCSIILFLNVIRIVTTVLPYFCQNFVHFLFRPTPFPLTIYFEK